MSTLQFKPCTIDDLDKMAEIFVEAFSGEPWNESWSKENAYLRLLNFYKSPGFVGYILKDDKQYAGMIVGQYQIYDTGWIFEIKDLCVGKAYQNKGLGKKLCHLLVDTLEKKVENIYLLTHPKLERYYEGLGFSKQPMIYMQKNK